MGAVTRLAAEHGAELTLRVVSLGQGQGPLAEALIGSARRDGG